MFSPDWSRICFDGNQTIPTSQIVSTCYQREIISDIVARDSVVTKPKDSLYIAMSLPDGYSKIS
jgi:hypothetical protein